jgi:hypothetical protein
MWRGQSSSTIHCSIRCFQAVDDAPDFAPPDPGDSTTQEQLVRAVRDLWSMVEDQGEDYIVFFDRRRMNTRVECTADGRYRLLWDDGDGGWTEFHDTFENPREACFHGFQGPH